MRKKFKILVTIILSLIFCVQLTTTANASNWVFFKNNSYISATIIKPNDSITLTSQASGGYSTTGYYQGRESDDVVKVKYLWTIHNNLEQSTKYYGPYTVPVAGTVKIKPPKFAAGTYSIVCTAIPITENGVELACKKNSFRLQVGGSSWVSFQNNSSVSKTTLKQNQSLNISLCSSGGYSPTGVFRAFVSDDVTKVRYVIKIKKPNDFYPTYLGPYTISIDSRRNFPLPLTIKGTYNIRILATPITKKGVELGTDFNDFSIKVN